MMTTMLSETNVIAVSFEDDDSAYAGLARLKQLDADGQIELRSAAVVERGEDGRVTTKETAGREEWDGTAAGGLIGLLVGNRRRPLGGADRRRHGSARRLAVRPRGHRGHGVGPRGNLTGDPPGPRDAARGASGAERPPGRRRRHGEPVGQVLRRAVADVEAEIAATEQAQHEARKKARRELRHEREETHKEHATAKVAELKAKLPRRKEGVPAGTSS